jgi:hypothetical protein
LFGADGKPSPAVRELLAAGATVVSADVFLTGEFLADDLKPAPPRKVDETFAGYTFGYNRPLLAQRVRDVLTVIAGVAGYPQYTTLHLVGTGEAGLWVLLARAVGEEKVKRCVVDLQGFGFGKIAQMNDPRMLPGGLKYGGIGGLAALAAPGELILFGTKETPPQELAALRQVYQSARGKLTVRDEPLTDDDAISAILK